MGTPGRATIDRCGYRRYINSDEWRAVRARPLWRRRGLWALTRHVKRLAKRPAPGWYSAGDD
jgi:hypothetical protein